MKSCIYREPESNLPLPSLPSPFSLSPRHLQASFCSLHLLLATYTSCSSFIDFHLHAYRLTLLQSMLLKMPPIWSANCELFIMQPKLMHPRRNSGGSYTHGREGGREGWRERERRIHVYIVVIKCLYLFIYVISFM